MPQIVIYFHTLADNGFVLTRLKNFFMKISTVKLYQQK